MNNLTDVDALFDLCINQLQEFEIWPGYYKRRYNEFQKYYNLFPQKNFGRVLEIGCGIGYQSAFLACLSQEVEATDVDFGNMRKHSRGIELTKAFIKKTGKENIRVSVADAQNLPFEDSAFDMVYCSYSFQYIPDKERALGEIKRVLKNDGIFFCVLPISTDRIGAFFTYYFYLLKRLTSRKKTKEPGIDVEQKELKSQRKITLRKLFPYPDDDANTYIGEIFMRLPHKWIRLFKKNGWAVEKTSYTAGKTNKQVLTIQRFINSLHSTGVVVVAKKIN